MQMLQAGGLEVMTDHDRAADHDNPEGYFEWEEIKRIKENPEILAEVGGRAVKVVSALIPALPPMHRYRVIFMTRPITEVVTSQKKMIERRRTRGANIVPDKLTEALIQHRDTILRGLDALPNFEVLEIDYPQLVAAPMPWIEKVNEFLGGRLDIEKMATCVKPALHRNRAIAAA